MHRDSAVTDPLSRTFSPQIIQVLLVGWYAVLADPQMPANSTLLDQAHNAIDRKLFSMKGFHHPGGSQAAFLTGLAHLYPYSDTSRTCAPSTRIYGCVKGRFPSSLATAKPRFYRGKF